MTDTRSKLRAVLSAQKTGTKTFGAFAARWMDTVMIHHKRSTQLSERSVIRTHLVPVFDDFNLVDMNAEVLQTWISGHPSSPKTLKNIVTTLKTMWSTAQEWGLVDTYPFKRLRLPAVVKGEVYHFSVEEALAIIAEAKGWHKIFIRTLAETGMRPGELAGLRRQDVGVRSISIGQSVWGREIQTPKTRTALRTFAISATLAEDLRRHVTETAANRYGLVFVSETGRPLSMDNFRHRTLDPILDRLGIRAKITGRCGAYAFRHMNATLMDTLGTPLKTRQKRLGHANIETTLYHYTHEVDAADVMAADQLGALLSNEEEAVQ